MPIKHSRTSLTRKRVAGRIPSFDQSVYHITAHYHTGKAPTYARTFKKNFKAVSTRQAFVKAKELILKEAKGYKFLGAKLSSPEGYYSLGGMSRSQWLWLGSPSAFDQE